MSISFQLLALFVLAIPVACVTWTITHEEAVREFREICVRKSNSCRHLYQRKFFYLFTCEYCLSHYITTGLLFMTRYKLLFPDWRGYLISGFSLVWVANIYMSLFARVRLGVKRERVEIDKAESDSEH
jgi:hypothetical protein